MINFISDAAVITKRQLQQLTRVPELLLFSTIQPIMFVLLFRYVFGGSIDTGQPGGYVQLLMPGIFVQTVAFTLAGTAVGLAADMQNILGFIFLLVFGFAMSWIGVLIGLSVREERVATNATFIVVFPLTFLSNAFAPTTGMPRPLQYVAEWNPVSTMVAGCRELFGLENQFGATAGSFPSENPLQMSVIYMILIMAIFIPLSIRKYNNAAKK